MKVRFHQYWIPIYTDGETNKKKIGAVFGLWSFKLFEIMFWLRPPGATKKEWKGLNSIEFTIFNFALVIRW